MAETLDTVILAPLLKVLPLPTQHTPNSYHQNLIATELNIFTSHQLHIQSLLTYAARLPTKPEHNPARRLHETLKHINHSSHQRIAHLLQDLSLTHTQLESPEWPDLLKASLTAQMASQLSGAIYHSHNVRTYIALLQPDTPKSPFRKRHANAKHVLVLRLQLAPLATMLADDQAAVCKRCTLHTPDTLTHWLTECPTLAIHRDTLDIALGKWAAELDNALNLAHNTTASHRWSTLSLNQQMQALQGEIPPQLLTLFKTPPLNSDGALPTPQPLLMHNVLRKLVNIMEAYCKHTFELIRSNKKPRQYMRT